MKKGVKKGGGKGGERGGKGGEKGGKGGKGGKKGGTNCVAEPESPGAPLLGWSRSRFFIWPESRAGAAFFKAAPAASFCQAKKESLVLLQNIS